MVVEQGVLEAVRTDIVAQEFVGIERVDRIGIGVVAIHSLVLLFVLVEGGPALVEVTVSLAEGQLVAFATIIVGTEGIVHFGEGFSIWFAALQARHIDDRPALENLPWRKLRDAVSVFYWESMFAVFAW